LSLSPSRFAGGAMSGGRPLSCKSRVTSPTRPFSSRACQTPPRGGLIIQHLAPSASTGARPHGYKTKMKKKISIAPISLSVPTRFGWASTTRRHRPGACSCQGTLVVSSTTRPEVVALLMQSRPPPFHCPLVRCFLLWACMWGLLVSLPRYLFGPARIVLQVVCFLKVPPLLLDGVRLTLGEGSPRCVGVRPWQLRGSSVAAPWQLRGSSVTATWRLRS
jgi:hypothetical protein